ncbi:MAG: NADH-quinone oxidoreductase subunit NuoF [Spirochaetaceae bacterium]|nr:MAG: NADH-quinone oxidoreductase subunit NuoF [Spirochaetaceae bacterium]
MPTHRQKNNIQRIDSPKDLHDLREKLKEQRDEGKVRIRICMTGCRAHGAEELMTAFQEEVGKKSLGVEILATGCHGFCAQAPVLVVDPYGIFYGGVSPADVPEIVSETVEKGNPVERLLYTDPVSGKTIVQAAEVPFYKNQEKIVLRNCGEIDPTDVQQYIERDGYAALAKALIEMKPEAVIEEITTSGLRGRGGAGFPAGRKWSFARAASGEPKYMICNADEGDPGAFMDRAVLEGDPHTAVEGMTIAAYAIGASEGYVYVRAEYPIAVEHLKKAIQDAEALGLLGENILGSGFSFRVRIKKGSGAFVCGEETALIASIEGRRGMPRPRPPFPAQSGVWGKPTSINNVETLANVPSIILNGGKWYAGIGTQTSKGTKVFALAGKVNNTGLVEVPMGITLKEVVFAVGGGIPDGRSFKAVQTGGPSGGCIPEAMLDLPVDYESLAKVGAIMGSGGMIVADDRTCMVDVSRFFMDFIQDESCGKCVPCRIGTKRMLEILVDVCDGRGSAEDLETLEELAYSIKDTALCGLGQTAPNPVLTTLKYFKEEYLAHIEDETCPAKVCKALIQYRIIPETCTGCGACLKVCPTEAITGEKKEVHFIHQEKCTKCGMCYSTCRFDAIEVN